jgi:hypothetical protein
MMKVGLRDTSASRCMSDGRFSRRKTQTGVIARLGTKGETCRLSTSLLKHLFRVPNPKEQFHSAGGERRTP